MVKRKVTSATGIDNQQRSAHHLGCEIINKYVTLNELSDEPSLQNPEQ